jgi:hypothetical protein
VLNRPSGLGRPGFRPRLAGLRLRRARRGRARIERGERLAQAFGLAAELPEMLVDLFAHTFSLAAQLLETVLNLFT